MVGYLALFVALSGTAIALPATGTVFSDDIVNGEVKTKDISDTNGVRSADAATMTSTAADSLPRTWRESRSRAPRSPPTLSAPRRSERTAWARTRS